MLTPRTRVSMQNWCDGHKLCQYNLGITRREMPQIRAGKFRAFVAWLDEHAITVRTTRWRVRNLRATQKEINAVTVAELAAGGVDKLLSERPLLASADGHILDGHTRWAALMERDPDAVIAVQEIQAPIHEVLSLAWSFPGVEYSTKMARRVASAFLRAHP